MERTSRVGASALGFRRHKPTGYLFTLLLAVAMLSAASNSMAQEGLGDLWALGNASGSGGAPMDLFLIDKTDGSSTFVVSTGTVGLRGLAIDPTTGQVYSSFGSTVHAAQPGLVEVDVATGTVTPIGGTKYITGLAFDSSGQLYGVENAEEGEGNVYKIDKATGAETLLATITPDDNRFGPDIAFDATTATLFFKGWPGGLWTVDTTTGDDSFVGLITLPYFASKGFDFNEFGNMFIHQHPCSGCGDAVGYATADDLFNPAQIGASGVRVWSLAYDLTGLSIAQVLRVKVTKTFSDDNDAEVDVTLTCNSGLPLEQTFTIAGGDEEGVTFVVTDIPESGATCEVTESGAPAGYTTVLNGGNGCTWEDVTVGRFTCVITNNADPATYTVYKDFTVQRAGGDVVIFEADVTIECDSEIDGYDWEDDGYWYLTGTLGDGESLVATVDTTEGSATCSATEEITQSGVEQSSSGCGPTAIPAGGSHTCTFTNTVFFEGIPTLSQYGLAILVLLTLGVGFVGLRRFV